MLQYTEWLVRTGVLAEETGLHHGRGIAPHPPSRIPLLSSCLWRRVLTHVFPSVYPLSFSLCRPSDAICPGLRVTAPSGTTRSTHRQSGDTKYKLPLLTSLFILAMTATPLGATSDCSEGVLSPAVVQGVRSRDVRERWSGAVDRSVLSHQTGRGRGP